MPFLLFTWKFEKGRLSVELIDFKRARVRFKFRLPAFSAFQLLEFTRRTLLSPIFRRAKSGKRGRNPRAQSTLTHEHRPPPNHQPRHTHTLEISHRPTSYDGRLCKVVTSFQRFAACESECWQAFVRRCRDHHGDFCEQTSNQRLVGSYLQLQRQSRGVQPTFFTQELSLRPDQTGRAFSTDSENGSPDVCSSLLHRLCWSWSLFSSSLVRTHPAALAS